MLSNCGHDENGKYTGGKAGDQTGTEWAIIPWYEYSGGWEFMIRYPDPAVGELIADLAQEGAKNDNAGYDQGERTTFWKQLKASGYLPQNIKSPCESDCSSGVGAIVKAVGYLLAMKALQDVSADSYTGDLRSNLQKAGFKVYTDSKYLKSDKYLLPGDILLKEYHHTCINISTGSAAGSDKKEEWKSVGTATSTGNSVNVRTGPGTGYASIGHVYTGNRFEVDGSTSGNWTHCKVAGIGIGWICTDYVAYDTPKAAETAKSEATQPINNDSDPADYFDAAIAGKYKPTTDLNMRKGAGKDKTILTVLSTADTVKNYGYYSKVGSTKWYYIQVTKNNKQYTGYASSKYLKKI